MNDKVTNANDPRGNLKPARGNRCFPRRLMAVCVALMAMGMGSFSGGEARRWQAANQPALQAASLEAAAGQGLLLGVFGGYRSIMADFVWVRSYVFWERQDRAACETYMRLAIALDPACTYFWRQAANIIAFDMARWEADALTQSGTRSLAESVAKRREHHYAENGLALHAAGAARNPQRQAQFWTDSAIICDRRLDDLRRAAECYKRAAECPNPAWFAPLAYERILVRDLHEPETAAKWIRAYILRLSATPNSDPYGIRPDLENRLKAIEAGKGRGARNPRN